MTVIWTALPNGLTGDPANRRVRLSVYVSMRLNTDDADGTLAMFPEAIGWPTLLQPGQFDLQVQSPGAPPVTATIVSPRPDLALWQALFSETTPVTSHSPDNLTRCPINTFSASPLYGDLQRGHQRLSVTSPVSLPTRTQLQEAYPELDEAFNASPPLPPIPENGTMLMSDLYQLHLDLAQNILSTSDDSDVSGNIQLAVSTARQIAEASEPGTFVPIVSASVSPFTQLKAFHHRESVDPQTLPPPVNPAQVLDFHQALAALAQYPELLRRLGLVLDLEIPESSLPGAPLSTSAGRVQIVPVFTNPLSFQNFSPLTAYILDGDRIFTPAPRNISQPETIAGLLNLAQPNQFDLLQVDVDGLGLKTLGMFTGNLLAVASEDGEGITEGIPATQSPGISIVRNKHGALLARQFATAMEQNDNIASDPQTVTLFDEDVTRGFRFDVSDTSGVWRSLHAQTGTYVFSNHPGGPLMLTFKDEGFVQPVVTQRVDGSADVRSQLYVHESLAHWQGWSLAAPRPGKALRNAGPENVSNEAIPGGFGLSVNFKATAGTLPRLRFNRNYQIRARVVDLAGNSISLDEATDVLQLLDTLNRPAPVLPDNLEDFTYRRFKPVVAPHLVAREKFTEGESIGRMVIRSNGGETSAACASRLMTLVASSRPQDRVIYTEANERHIVPPKTSLHAIETHGMLDAAFGAGANPRSVYNLARKEKGRLTDNTIVDVATGTEITIPGYPQKAKRKSTRNDVSMSTSCKKALRRSPEPCIVALVQR
jgi:hypothetical protein